jgi:hypothetical protein
MDVAVLLGVTQYILGERCKGFGGTSFTLRKLVLASSEMLVPINFTTRRHTPENSCLNILQARTSPHTRV